MEHLFPVALGVHVLFGVVALVIAPLAMATVKGGLWHRRWGRIYFWAMAVVSLSAVVMCWVNRGVFLFLIAVFSFYLALTGYTVLRRKQPEDRASPLDWFAAATMLLTAGALIVWGLQSVDRGEGVVCVVFGAIGLFLGGSDVRSFIHPPQRERAWWFAHMTRFLAAYIATVTAFSVLNFEFLPFVWRWLWPTLVGAVGISLWRRYYAREFKRADAATAPPSALARRAAASCDGLAEFAPDEPATLRAP